VFFPGRVYSRHKAPLDAEGCFATQPDVTGQKQEEGKKQDKE
jgi:hypothetical protein